MMAEMLGTGRDPIVAAAELYTNPQVPLEIRAMLMLGMARYFYPALSATQIQQTVAHADLSGEAAERFLANLERVRAGVPLLEAKPDREVSLADLGLMEAAGDE